MKLSDIIALAKNGYTPGDIKELLTLAEPETTQGQDAQNGGSDSDGNPDADTNPDANTDEESSEKENVPDYKALFEAEKAKRLAAEKIAANKETVANSEVSDFETALKFVNDLI